MRPSEFESPDVKPFLIYCRPAAPQPTSTSSRGKVTRLAGSDGHSGLWHAPSSAVRFRKGSPYECCIYQIGLILVSPSLMAVDPPTVTGAARHLIQAKAWFPLENPEFSAYRWDSWELFWELSSAMNRRRNIA